MTYIHTNVCVCVYDKIANFPSLYIDVVFVCVCDKSMPQPTHTHTHIYILYRLTVAVLLKL